MKVFWDPVQLRHAPKFFLQRGHIRQHFEVPARATALLEGVHALGLVPEMPPPAPRAALEAVHPAAFLDFLESAAAAWEAMPDHGPELVPNIHPTPEMLAQGAVISGTVIGQLGWYTADLSSPMTADTWPAAYAAASVALAAADEALAGRHAYALTRPPGHHAYAARTGGHCYLNNAALAAQRLRDGGADRVAVLDIDSHHGNGTQGIFWDRADVLFASIHGDPHGYYPWYIGHQGERGGGAGEGFNHNYPLPRGAGDEAWLAALDDALHVIGLFRPDAIVLSLGFDASVEEPLNFISVSDEGFARAGAAIAGAGYPTVIVQEGGYNTDVLGRLLGRVLGGFG